MESCARGAGGPDAACVVCPHPWPVLTGQAGQGWAVAGDVCHLCPELGGRFWVSQGQREPAVCVRGGLEVGGGEGQQPGRLNNPDGPGKKGWGRGQPRGVRAASAMGHLPCCRSQAFATAPGWCPRSPPVPAECWLRSARA